MVEREGESNKQEGITRAFYEQASTPEGFTIHLREHDTLKLLVSAGEITLFIAAMVQPEAPDVTAAERAPAPEAAPDQQSAAERQSRRVKFSGRMASDPRYSPLPQKGLRVGFVVAEHHPEGPATFHRTYATGEYARRIQQKHPTKGDEVIIDGERQMSRSRRQDGAFQGFEVVYCYGLRVKTTPRRER